MEMQLFEVKIVREDDPPYAYVVAPSEARAVEFVREHHERIGSDYDEVQICRVDETLEGAARTGLDDMLGSAPVGFASLSLPGIGWVAHAAAVHRLRLYRIEEQDGDTMHVIAPNPDIASAVWAIAVELGEDHARLYRIFDETAAVLDGDRAGLEALLEFGPIGEVTRAANGWRQRG